MSYNRDAEGRKVRMCGDCGYSELYDYPCGEEKGCATCVDGELSSQYYNPGDWDWAEDETPPIDGPKACETCDMPYGNHRCKCGHKEKVKP